MMWSFFMFYLYCIQSILTQGVRIENSLKLLVENDALISLQTSVNNKRVSIVFDLPIKEQDIVEQYNLMASLGLEFILLAGIKDSTLVSALDLAIERTKESGKILRHCNLFRGDDNQRINNGAQKCIFKPPVMTSEILGQVKDLNLEYNKINAAWTKEDIDQDLSKYNTVQNFIDSYNSLADQWLSISEKMLFQMDQLRNGDFPPSLTGAIEIAECLKDIRNENIEVLECFYNSLSFMCELEYSYPNTFQRYKLLTPLNYEGISLENEDLGILYVKHMDNSRLDKFSCDLKDSKGKMYTPVCSLIQDDFCTMNIYSGQIDAAIRYCKFVYSEQKDVNILGSGILIEDTEAILVENGKPVFPGPRVPFVIYSPNEVTVTIHGIEYKISGTEGTVPVIKISMLTEIQRSALQWKMFWQAVKDVDILEYVGIVLNVLLMIVGGIVWIIQCVSKGRNKHRKRMIDIQMHKLRKTNYKESQKMLKHLP
jgi:hypothetical protein